MIAGQGSRVEGRKLRRLRRCATLPPSANGPVHRRPAQVHPALLLMSYLNHRRRCGHRLHNWGSRHAKGNASWCNRRCRCRKTSLLSRPPPAPQRVRYHLPCRQFGYTCSGVVPTRHLRAWLPVAKALNRLAAQLTLQCQLLSRRYLDVSATMRRVIHDFTRTC